MDSINQYITSPVVNACLSRQSYEECLVPETEVLREDGRWIRLDEIKVGDRILSVNQNLEIYYAEVTKMFKKNIKGIMYNLSGPDISQVVTKGHRVPIYYKGKLVIKKAKDLYSLLNNITNKVGLYYIPDIDISDTIIEQNKFEITRNFTMTKEYFETTVYCPTVKGGLFICRHNDKVSLTGNSLHSESYSVMAEDICQDTDRIFEMHLHNEELYLKNKAVADMYSILYQGDTPTKEDLLVAFGANQILEQLVFPGGFVFFYAIEGLMPASAEMISEINKDETLSHVPLFMHIFRTAVSEEFNGVVPEEVKNRIHDMIKIMVDAEIRWTTYVTKGILGFSDTSIKTFIESQGNSVCKNLGLPLLYEQKPLSENPLYRLMLDHLKGGEVETKTLFFEGNPVDYAKTSIDMDLDLSNLDDL